MTLIELLWFLMLFSLSFLCGKCLGSYYGIAGWFIGFTIAFILLLFLWWILERLLYQLLVPRPLCKNGKCFSKDYECIEIKEDSKVYRCRCGDYYLSKEVCFMRITKDGSAHPYKIKHNLLSYWEDDLSDEGIRKDDESASEN